MAQRHRGRVTQSATSDDAERLILLESACAVSPQPQRPRLKDIAEGGANGGGNHASDLTGHSGQPASPLEGDDMDSGRGWHNPSKRGARATTQWFNNVMGVLLLVLAVFGYAVCLPLMSRPLYCTKTMRVPLSIQSSRTLNKIRDRSCTCTHKGLALFPSAAFP
jgi:hypothetical protein